jgi:hypothetical protein
MMVYTMANETKIGWVVCLSVGNVGKPVVMLKLSLPYYTYGYKSAIALSYGRAALSRIDWGDAESAEAIL